MKSTISFNVTAAICRIWCVLYTFNVCSCLSPSSLSGRIPGIWQLEILESKVSLNSGKTIIEQLVDSQIGDPTGGGAMDEMILKQVLLKFQQDGSFRQCDEEYDEGRWISGRWSLHGDQQRESSDYEMAVLRLAIDRQYFGPPTDKLLTGKFATGNDADDSGEKTKGETSDEISESSTLSISGSVTTGKFLYPKKHPSFFEEPIMNKETFVGSFQLQQVMSFARVIPELGYSFQQSDFYDRRFNLTSAGGSLSPPSPSPLSFDFFTNNSFAITSIDEMIAVGRFAVDDQNQLLLEVCWVTELTSDNEKPEGPVFAFERKQSFKGRISREENRLFVEGTIPYAPSSLGGAEAGTFLLQEKTDKSPSSVAGRHRERERKDGGSMCDSVFE